jgi:Flp pilus assembly protein TadD
VGEVLATMGTVALRAADFERAAVIFEQLYERRPADPNALPLLASAARIRLLLGDVSAATESLRILRSKGDVHQQRNAHQMLMEAYDRAGDGESLASVASTAKKAAPSWYGAGVYLGIAYAAQGKLELARREIEAALRMRATSDFDEALAARAAFTLGQVTQAELEAVPIRDASAVESAVAAKLELLGAVEQAYVNTIGAGDPLWIVAALHESARLYAGFAETIASLPAPDGMSAADREAYRNALAQQAAPYRQQAADTLAACKARAQSLRVFTPYAAACMRDDLGVVGLESRRRRTRSGGGESVAHEAAEMRRQLAKQPESIELLLSLSRLIVQTGDYHLARLMLSKAAETNTDNPQILNLLGVSLWMLGDTQGAFTNIKAAHDKGLNLATANLAALYAAYDYVLKAEETLGTVEELPTLDLTVPDLHPGVATYVRSAGAG